MGFVINGLGVAGPTLSFWLRKAGYEVLLVEAAPRLRSGGHVIEFGLAGYDVAERMGLIPQLTELGYQVKGSRSRVEGDGRPGAYEARHHFGPSGRKRVKAFLQKCFGVSVLS